MKKNKEFIKSYAIGLIFGIIVSGTISVIAATYFPSNDVTYDNTNTELKSENVQDAIDELYGVCFPKPAGEQIIEDAGLEKDPYECRYFFTGANPNNYITFNNETAGWRIISVECDGTIKIMRINSIGDRVWDKSGSNNWARPAELNTYLNGTYYNGLNATAQSQIVAKDWSIGGVTFDDNNMTNTINNENSKKWNGKVALVTVSEYLRSNSNKNSCGSISLNNDNKNSCVSTGWMDTTSVSYWWTLSPEAEISYYSFYVHSGGGVSTFNINVYNAVRPALYLSSEIKLSGSGTMKDPYTINS